MQLSNILFAALTALVSFEGVAASQCRIANGVKDNCCWGGRGGGSWIDRNADACNRQRKGMGNPDNVCYDGGEDENHCANNGVAQEQCNADCCDTTTGWGTGCPK